MNRKNRRLLVVFVVLIVANLMVAMFAGKSKSGVSFDESTFTLTDTASVQKIQIGEKLILTRKPQGWGTEEGYSVDPTISRLLLNIMTRVRVKKPVEDSPKNTQKIEFTGENPLSFEVWGNATKTKTYASLVGSEEAYEIYIPGYNEYVGGIFELHPDQWRDRLVMNGSWRTIQNLDLDYRDDEQEDISITFRDSFFEVAGVSSLDSTAVIDYLNQFQYFQANEWISEGRFKRYDSLSKMPPLATLKLETINTSDPVLVEIFPKIDGEAFHLAQVYDGSMMVIDQSRVKNILAKRALFRYE